MLAHIRSRLTFANVVSLLALFVALSGGAYALTIPKNSVGPRQLKKNAVTTPKLKNDAVGSAKVRDRSLRATDFAPGQLPAGSRGLQGPPGARGERGLQGAAGATNVIVRLGTPNSILAGTTESVTATCQPGERAVGGGFAPESGVTVDTVRVVYSTPTSGASNAGDGTTPTGWNTRVFNGSANSYNAVPRVICASP